MDNIIFTLTNQLGNTLALDGISYSVLDYDGLDSSDYEISTQKLAGNVGSFLTNQYMLSRVITIEFIDVEYNNIPIKRRELLSFFAPFSYGTLVIDFCGIVRKIDYKIQLFEIKSKKLHEPMRCVLELLCVDPFFKDLEERRTLIADPSSDTAISHTINNNSTNDTYTRVVIYGMENVGFRIRNNSNGSSIKLIKQVPSMKFLSIDGVNKQATVISNNVVEDTNAFEYLSLDSTYLILSPGDNNIVITRTDTTTIVHAEVFYTQIYGGI